MFLDFKNEQNALLKGKLLKSSVRWIHVMKQKTIFWHDQYFFLFQCFLYIYLNDHEMHTVATMMRVPPLSRIASSTPGLHCVPLNQHHHLPLPMMHLAGEVIRTTRGLIHATYSFAAKDSQAIPTMQLPGEREKMFGIMESFLYCRLQLLKKRGI